MPIQKLRVVRQSSLTKLSNMEDVIRTLAKDIVANGYSVQQTEISYDVNANNCHIEIFAEKRAGI